MSKGRYTADLDLGDTFGPMEYDVTPFAPREYCHSVELHQEVFQAGDASGQQAWPVPMVHMDKLRFYHHDCPGGSGPNARIHYEFDVEWSGRINTGDRLTTTGRVARRFMRRDREYLEVDLEIRSATADKVVVKYKDTTVLSYRTKSKTA